MTEPIRPPYEPTTEAMVRLWRSFGCYVPITSELLASRDAVQSAAEAEAERQFQLRLTGLVHRDITIPGPAGEITVAVLTEPNPRPGPLVISFHGGGLVAGNRFHDLAEGARIIAEYGGTVISPEYRLAPEHPAPSGFDDCYAAYLWATSHAQEVGGEVDRIIVIGTSAGGNLAMAVALAARDRGALPALGLLVSYPMLDDRNDTVSVRQYWRHGIWTGADNEAAWGAVLGQRRRTEMVTPYEAPARATWLGGLPPVFLDVASTEPFRDEVVAFASAIWRDGGDAELHVFPGGTHGHDLLSAKTWIGRGVRYARTAWVRHLLVPDDPQDTVDFVASLKKYPLGGGA